MEHGVKRFVYLSTADVYGLHDFNGESEEELAFDETVKNPYPKYKILSEKWLAANLPRALQLREAHSIRFRTTSISATGACSRGLRKRDWRSFTMIHIDSSS